MKYVAITIIVLILSGLLIATIVDYKKTKNLEKEKTIEIIKNKELLENIKKQEPPIEVFGVVRTGDCDDCLYVNDKKIIFDGSAAKSYLSQYLGEPVTIRCYDSPDGCVLRKGTDVEVDVVV